MRILYCELVSSNSSIKITPVEPSPTPPYAILSHRWRDDELSFADLSKDGLHEHKVKLKKGYAKVEKCCRQALLEGYDYVWINTCCIDKTSSAELSEAINSMYAWYRDSQVCYVYLDDVKSAEDPKQPYSTFRRSEWFRRGWTLQELIAPQSVVFFAQDWEQIGSKASLADTVRHVTKIPIGSLLPNHTKTDLPSIAQRMSWASRRTTSRIEDRAYSLMGLFDIHMPIIYGEGTKAFRRLQEEILKISNDQTIFAWNWQYGDNSSEYGGLLASSPRQFVGSSNLKAVSLVEFYTRFAFLAQSAMKGITIRPDYEMTNFGVRLQLPLEKMDEWGTFRAYLACERKAQHVVSIDLAPRDDYPAGHFIRPITSYIMDNKQTKESAIPHCTLQEIFVGDISQRQRHFSRVGLHMFQVKIENSDPNRFRCVYSGNSYPRQQGVSYQERKAFNFLLRPDSLTGSHETIVFTDTKSPTCIVLVLGFTSNGAIWSDILFLNNLEFALTLKDELASPSGRQSDLRDVIASKRLDWVKKPLPGVNDRHNDGNVFMTIRPLGDNTSAVRITL